MIELGKYVSGKEANAGKIGYEVFSTGLDIIGAGNSSGDRLVTLYDDVNVIGDFTASNISTNDLVANVGLTVGILGTTTKKIIYERINCGTSGSRSKTISLSYSLGGSSANYLVFAAADVGSFNGFHNFTISIGNKTVSGSDNLFDLYIYRNDATFWGTNMFANVQIVVL